MIKIISIARQSFFLYWKTKKKLRREFAHQSPYRAVEDDKFNPNITESLKTFEESVHITYDWTQNVRFRV